jgi:hypothetical protein
LAAKAADLEHWPVTAEALTIVNISLYFFSPVKDEHGEVKARGPEDCTRDQDEP